MKYTFTRTFSLAHRLFNGPSPKCHAIHGHTWKLIWSVNLDGHDLDTHGMVKPFHELKSKVHSWIDNHVDHSIALADEPLLYYLRENEPNHRVLHTKQAPTTEVLALLFLSKLTVMTGEKIEITLEETPTNTVHLTPWDYGSVHGAKWRDLYLNSWPCRDDMSINDF